MYTICILYVYVYLVYLLASMHYVKYEFSYEIILIVYSSTDYRLQMRNPYLISYNNCLSSTSKTSVYVKMKLLQKTNDPESLEV